MRTARSSPRAQTSFEDVAVIGFKNSQAGVEQLPFRHDNDVETGRDLVSTENLPNQPFRSITDYGAAQLARGGDSQPADFELVRQNKHRGEAAVDPGAVLVDVLKIGAPTDPLVGSKFIHYSR